MIADRLVLDLHQRAQELDDLEAARAERTDLAERRVCQLSRLAAQARSTTGR